MSSYNRLLHNRLQASFRDPAGRLIPVYGRVIRIVAKSGTADLHASLASNTVRRFEERGRLVRTEILEGERVQELAENPEVKRLLESMDVGMVLEHESVPFPSFPYEWPPEMLHAAGCLTLDLAQELLSEGLGLKDATPYNILFRGPNPVFVDWLSIEQRDPSDPTWLPYAQFVRTFLLPLLLHQDFGVSLAHWLTTRRDGVEPEKAYQLYGTLGRLVPPVLTLVSIPTWLGRRQDPGDPTIYQRKSVSNPEKAKFIVASLLRELRRTLHSLAPTGKRKSVWSDYMVSEHSYSPENFSAKQAFVEAVLRESHPKTVLDVGCNIGHFSVLAAKNGASVVAIDSDPVVLGLTWRRAAAEGLDILPLEVNLAWPTPAIGWRNRECPDFLSRSHEMFDAVFMLAVVHHLLVSERISLPEILDLAAELTRDLLVIEFVGPKDMMFHRLLRGREHLFRDFTLQSFEQTCQRHFRVVRSQPLDDASRCLYALRKKK